MADPRQVLETALYDALTSALTPTVVYNTRATGATGGGYVVFTHVGTDDTWHNLKKRGYVEEYEAVAVDTDRDDAAALADDLDTALEALDRNLTVTGYTMGEVTRIGTVDRVDIMQNGTPLYSVGGRWRLEMEVA
jgi:hypothetical protein